MRTSKSAHVLRADYRGLFAYAKKNSQTRNLYQEYWQRDTRQAPSWQRKLSPRLERSETSGALTLRAEPETAGVASRKACEGLLAYAHENAVHTDLYATRAHPNLKRWQTRLRYEKGAHLKQRFFKRVA